MTIKSYKLGPGSLSFTIGTALDVSAQVRNARVEWTENVDTVDPVDVLSGEQLAKDETVTYTSLIAGTVIQDIAATDFVAWTWTNRGTTATFTFIPNTVSARKVTGTCRIAPLTVGGDVKARNTADFSFECLTDPVLGATP